MKLAPKEEAASEQVKPVKPVEPVGPVGPVDPSGKLTHIYALIMKDGLRWLLEDL